MTNEEKARELALKNYPYNMTIDGEYDMNENDRILFIEGALKMAEWKDNTFNCLIDEKINEVNENMKSCNIGEIYGVTVMCGYKMAVEHMLSVLRDLKK